MFNNNLCGLDKSRGLSRRLFPAAAIFLCVLFACQQKDASRNEEAVVKVNNHTISQAEFWEHLGGQADKSSYACISKDTKKACIEILIERALLVQEAVKDGLSKEKRFIRSVERYWEQTLISNLLKKKEAEFEKMVVVSDDEIENYYKLMGVGITCRYYKVNDLDMGREYLRRINNGEETPWDEESRFLRIEDVPLSLGMELFNKKKGESFASQTGQYYIVAQVIDRKEVARAPLKELRDEIKRELLKYKKEDLIQKWVNDLKQNATIEINETYLK